MPGKCGAMLGHSSDFQMQKAAFGGVAFRLKKTQGLPGVFF
jgi:hypothetical protein